MPSASVAQLAANRANALHSTGPKTAVGKAKSSLNAVKTGLTGRTVLLPEEDAAPYAAHLARLQSEWKPATDEERTLVQSIADTEWRLRRIPALEAGIYALGRLEAADLFDEQADPAVRAALCDVWVFRTHGRELSNLSLQEVRLRRHLEKDIAALKALQEPRLRRRQSDLSRAIELYRHAQYEHRPFDPAAFGFEFSLSEIEASLTRSPERQIDKTTP